MIIEALSSFYLKISEAISFIGVAFASYYIVISVILKGYL